ncbi:ROK family protein [Telmatocola sphagniphila]|uniref:ROK family protein n=1 Tax=Telmatocola sphagniphila TaxID=1123043 RepID=A0A8E6B5D3_9BACT|nr:ROK family protein [Telmatocola sphagniphila]QVL32445.1 ROK family protein [Telmatocola sphagniphila]
MYLGIEIGGTKLQVALGRGDGKLLQQWRGRVDTTRGAAGIQDQLKWVIADMQRLALQSHSSIQAIGVGFGGPIDHTSGSIIKSHQITGWDNFPLTDWLKEISGLPCLIGNDADVAGLGEAMHGAGRDRNPIFYITIGSGIGGGLIIDKKIYTGCGRGAAEIGHLIVDSAGHTLESQAAGWSIERTGNQRAEAGQLSEELFLISSRQGRLTCPLIAEAAARGDRSAIEILDTAITPLAIAIRHVVCLLCPQRIIIGGGVSLMGDVIFEPLRKRVAEHAFPPFAGLTDIVPAELGEEVVLHGAIALASQSR